MKVAELKMILEHVPDDLDVVVSSSGGCGHVTGIRRRTKKTKRLLDRAASPAVLHITAWRGPAWFDTPCDFRLSGPFSRRDELEVKLDGIER